MNKLGKLELNFWTVILGLIALYFFVAPIRSFVDGVFAGVGKAPTGGAQPAVIECIYDGAVMTLGPIEKKYDPTTSVTGIGDRVIINGKDRDIKQDGSTLDVNFKDSVTVYYHMNSTIAKTAKTRYYTSKHEFVVPCTSAFSTADEEINPNGAHKLVAAAFPTITFFNDDDGLKNAVKYNETMSASDTSNIEMKVISANKAGYSPYGKVYITFKYNTSNYNNIELTGSENVASVASDATPTHTQTKVGETGYSLKTFSTPGVASLSPTTQKFNVLVETTSTTMISSDNCGSCDEKSGINVTFDDESFYRNTDSGLIEFGSEDDQDNDVGMTSQPNATILIVSS